MKEKNVGLKAEVYDRFIAGIFPKRPNEDHAEKIGFALSLQCWEAGFFATKSF